MDTTADPFLVGRMTGDPEWRFCLPIALRFSDLDAFGHVNNAVYLTYIEAARTTYLRRVAGIQGVRDMAMILARAEVDYRLPVLISDRLEAEVRAVAIGTKSFTLAYRLWVTRAGTRLLVAESRTVLVCYDYPNERSVPVPPDLIAGLEAFEGRSLRAAK
jgi:acyl-CoA thioester hydrolase